MGVIFCHASCLHELQGISHTGVLHASVQSSVRGRKNPTFLCIFSWQNGLQKRTSLYCVCVCFFFCEICKMCPKGYLRGRHGGCKKEGGWKTSRMIPIPKGDFGPPLIQYVSTPLRCQCSVFPVQKSTTEKLFWRARSLVRFPPPIRFAPPPYHGPRYLFNCAPFCRSPFCVV